MFEEKFKKHKSKEPLKNFFKKVYYLVFKIYTKADGELATHRNNKTNIKFKTYNLAKEFCTIKKMSTFLTFKHARTHTQTSKHRNLNEITQE